MSLDFLTQVRIQLVDPDRPEEVTLALESAICEKMTLSVTTHPTGGAKSDERGGPNQVDIPAEPTGCKPSLN
ncbi:MAG: hypothetical protein IIC71_11050 [Acidobacteria bacterium]|nr:hypothetical protein [Acidobacteriota bacterium]